NQVDVFLIRPPAYSALVKQTRKMQLIVLVADLPRAVCGRKGIIVIEYAKIGSGFRPDVVGLGRMNVRVRAAGCSQNAAIVRGKRRLLADVDLFAVNDSRRGPVHKTIDEWCSRILKNLLDSAGELVGRLGPIVVLHRNNKYRLDFFRAGGY